MHHLNKHCSPAILTLVIFLYACSGQRLVQTDLYFGRLKQDGTTVSEAEWKSFAEAYVSKVFTQGSTSILAQGSWYDPTKQQIISEPTCLVTSINKPSPALSKSIDSLCIRYKQLFQQQAVLRVDRKVKTKLL